MNAKLKLLCRCGTLLTLLVSSAPLFAQSYSIDWYTIDGGGGTSTNGQFTLSGTIGQPDASQSTMAGGAYSLTGGFWALFALQTPGAPVLAIRLTSTNTVMVYWPSPSTGFNLQLNTNLTTTNWIAATNTVTDIGTIKYILVDPPAGNRYYRLRNP